MSIYRRLQKHILADEGIVIDTYKSKGSWIVDAETKKRYLDCSSQYGAMALGWNHPALTQAQMELGHIALHKVANSDYYTEVYANFVEKFAGIIPDFTYSFFIEGGTLGVENSLKAAFDWKARLLHLNDSAVNKLEIVHLERSFHGRSGYCLSLTNTNPDKTDLFPKFKWTRISNKDEDLSLEQAERALKTNYVAAIILEPIQGEGGDHHFSANYIKALRNLADQYQTLLIFDEVQTGIGLTGKMWAYEHFGIIPDMIAFGKKVQVCGFSSTDKIDLVLENVFQVPSRINSTFGGNIVDMARFSIIIDVIQKEKLIENAEFVGNYLKKELLKLPFISNVRGRGLMLAFDLENKEKRDKFLIELQKKMVVLACGEKSIRLRPHLDFSLECADTAIDFIKEVIFGELAKFYISHQTN